MSCPVRRWATYVPRLPARGACTCAGPAHQSVCRRRASLRGERATPPVRPPKRVPARASPQGERATPPVRLSEVCRRRASPREERATAPVRLSKVYRRCASPRGERAPTPVRPPQRVPALRLPARAACTCAGPPTKACADAAPPREGSVHLRRSALHSATVAAPPREGSVQLRRFAHHSVCRRRASPRGERATPPVRPPKRVPAPRLPARGVCTCAGPPDRACAGARLSARGVCDRVGPPLPGAGRRTPT